MSQREFVIIYVALPLAIALGWLLWRGRRFLRNMILYAVAVVALLALVRLGHMAWGAWENWQHPIEAIPPARACLAPGVPNVAGPRGACWT